MRLFASLSAGLLALAFAGATFAQSVSTLPVKNASGSTVNMSCQQDASGACHYRNVLEGLKTDGTPVAVVYDGSDSGLWMHVVNWPTSYAVTGTFWPYTLNGDGGVPSHVTNFPASFGISGTLPAFASTPTVNLGTLNGAATAANQTNVQSAPGASATAAVTVQGSASGVALPITGTVTATPGAGTFNTLDSADTTVAAGSAPTKAQLGAVQYNSSAPTLTAGQTVAAQGDVNGNLKVNCVTGCSGGGGGAVTIAAGADATEGNVSDAAYTGSGNATVDALLKGLYAAMTSGQIHTDLVNLNTTAGAPAKLNDSGGGDVSDAVNHALVFEPSFAGRFVQAPVSITSTSATTLVAAQGAGLYTYVTDLDCSNAGQYSFGLQITNSTGTVLYTVMSVPAGGGYVKPFSTPVGGNGQMATNTALTVQAFGNTPYPIAASGSSYNSTTGVVSLTLSSPASFSTGATIYVTGLTGTGTLASLQGLFSAASVSGTTVTYQGPTGLGTVTITGGSLLYSSGAPVGVCDVQGRVRTN